MLPYPMIDYNNQNPQVRQEVPSTKVRKPRKCSQRTTRRSLKREFEKLLVPAFASKIARTFSDSINNRSPTTRPKKPPKVLPDNLADFIIDNETKKPVISEGDYMQCMEILINTKNRKNQIMQICQVLTIDKESIRKKRKSRSANAIASKVYKPRKKRTKKIKLPKLNDTFEALVSDETSPESSPKVEHEELLSREQKRESLESFCDTSLSKSDVSTTLTSSPLSHQPTNDITVMEEPEVSSSQSSVFLMNNSSLVSDTAIAVQSEIEIEPVEEIVTSHDSDLTSASEPFVTVISESLAETVADYACMFIGV